MCLLCPISAKYTLPQLFTNPFDYVPCEVVKSVAQELISRVESHEEWREELSCGKMFGVLVCETKDGELGYLSAFSGNLNGQTTHPDFVPPIFDLLQTNSFFKMEEVQISAINNRIKSLSCDKEYIALIEKLDFEKDQSNRQISDYKIFMSQQKTERQTIRANFTSAQTIERITKESQFQKAELKRIVAQCRSKIEMLEIQKSQFDNKIEQLAKQRQTLSKELQYKIFENYMVCNHMGGRKSMIEIFEQSRATLPPSGAGECAAPKLLHYAFVNGLIPIAMGEFWYGRSPKGEVRHHGEFYSACKSKCEPILGYMLSGMRLNPSNLDYSISRDLSVVYKDEWVAIVDKPAGMLSVCGRVDVVSVEDKLTALFPQYPDCKVVHRLDMDTSGILMIALNSEIHTLLQQQFEKREVEKEYLALLDGVISNDLGEVNLPLSADYGNRPRQRVDYIGGKQAHTSYRVLSIEDNISRVILAPHSGRTHQLRVHCAHEDGLGVPIVGDRLYGHPSSRLMLQAIKITFTHPVNQERITVELEPEF